MKAGDLIRVKDEKTSRILPIGHLGLVLKIHEKIGSKPETCSVRWLKPIKIVLIPGGVQEDDRGVYRTDWLEVVP